MSACRLLVLCGSLRPGSHTRRALEIAARSAAEAGAEIEFAPDEWLRLPLCDGVSLDAPPEPVARLRAAVARSSALLLGTPEYCGSVSAVLKNAIEWLTPETLAYRTAGCIAVSAGPSAEGSLTALRELCLRQGVWVLPAYGAVPLSERILGTDENGDELARAVLDHLRALGAALPEAADRLRRDREPSTSPRTEQP